MNMKADKSDRQELKDEATRQQVELRAYSFCLERSCAEGLHEQD